MTIEQHIKYAIEEDLGEGDHTSLSTIPDNHIGRAKLIAKEDGIVAGVEVAKIVYQSVDKNTQFTTLIKDGSAIKKGDLVFTVEGKSISILSAERLALNYMQRMSGIATSTNEYMQLIEGTKTQLLDTRKTTPLMRRFEKIAVKLGGGTNHRMGLYDMVMIKDNHIDFSGGVVNAIKSCHEYLKNKNLDLKVEIEIRNYKELSEVIEYGHVDIVLLDNFTPKEIEKALVMIGGKFKTEASGGITKDSIRAYAETGVDFISVGALTHQIKSLDLSLLAY